MKDKKYELVKDDSIEHHSITLYRIKALKDFSDVKKGDIGGYIEHEYNLSQEGNCWVYDNAVVTNNAIVRGNAKVCNNAEVYEYASLLDKTVVSNNAKVHGNASIGGSTEIRDTAEVYECKLLNTKVSDNAKVYGCNLLNTKVIDDAVISGNIFIKDAIIYSNAEIVNLSNCIKCYDRVTHARIGKNAYITSPKDYLAIGAIGSRDDTTTFYLTKDKEIYVSCGCFNDSIEEFKKEVCKTHKSNKLYRTQYLKAIKFAKTMLLLKED